jgi:hypothetical protein
MILRITYRGQRLAVTVQPAHQPLGQPSARTSSAPSDQPAGEISVLLFGHTLGKALSQTFGARA